MNDWRTRRAKNNRVNEELQQLAREEIFEYFLLGRDDSSPLSASHQEARHLEQRSAGIPSSRYLSIPGADNLGLGLVVHAINDIEFRLPFVSVFFAPGAGAATIASYEDHPLRDSIPQHITIAGGILLDLTKQPDLVLAVNTPESGVTLEANQPGNVAAPNPATQEFVRHVEREINKGRWVAVGDVRFANGADNSLMADFAETWTPAEARVLFRLEHGGETRWAMQSDRECWRPIPRKSSAGSCWRSGTLTTGVIRRISGAGCMKKSSIPQAITDSISMHCDRS